MVVKTWMIKLLWVLLVKCNEPPDLALLNTNVLLLDTRSCLLAFLNSAIGCLCWIRE